MSDLPSAKPKAKRASRAGLYIPFGLLIVAALAWTGYWFYAADLLKKRLTVQAEALRQSGYVVEHAPISVEGYPFRLHVPFRDFKLLTPGGQGFSAPELDAEAMAYAPDKWVLVVPGILTFHRGLKGGVDAGTVELTADNMRASVTGLGKAAPSFSFVGMNVKAKASNPVFPFGFDTASRLEAYSRPNVTKDPEGKAIVTADAIDMLFRLTDATGGAGSFVAKVSPAVPLSLHVEGTINTVSALSGTDLSHALSHWSQSKGQMTGFKGSVRAGEAELLLSSQALSLDEAKTLVGYMDVEISGTGKPFEILNGLGLLSLDTYPEVRPLLGIEVNTHGPRRLTLGFREGQVWLGPIKVSKAPVLP